MGHLRHFGGPIRHLRGHLRHIVEPMVGVGTRSQIQVRLSGMNISYARTSKLVSDFLYLERSLVHTWPSLVG